MDIIAIKTGLCATIGALGGAVAALFGGWSADLMTLVLFMAADYITGLVLAAVFHKSRKSASGTLESRAGLKGLCRKGAILLVVLVAQRLDMLTGLTVVRTAVVIGFIANETISIFENLALMGIHMPAPIKKALDVLNDRTSTREKEENK